jgi:hypothetical protein
MTKPKFFCALCGAKLKTRDIRIERCWTNSKPNYWLKCYCKNCKSHLNNTPINDIKEINIRGNLEYYLKTNQL